MDGQTIISETTTVGKAEIFIDRTLALIVVNLSFTIAVNNSERASEAQSQ
jgi:hypothetical protein